MKFTVIGPTHPYKGGISHFTTIFVSQLRKNNSVDFISWKIQYPKFLYPVEQKDTKSKKSIQTQAAYILNFYNPFSWLSAAYRIKSLKPEKLILTWVTPVQAPIYIVISMVIKWFTKTRIVFLCHNSLPHESKFYDKFLTKQAFKFGDEFIAHSEQDKEIILKLSNNKPVIMAFHPIYDEFNDGKKWNIKSAKDELGLKQNVLLFFGYIRPYKGLKYLIQAMPEIIKNNPDTSLLVVGEFWAKDKPAYEKMVKKLKLSEHVIFVDQYVPNEEVGKYFSVANLVVCPYVSATQSGIVQMAYAFNKPVITTNVGGLKDVVVENVSGLLIDPKSKKAIAEATLKALNLKFQVFKVLNKFSWSKYISLTNSGGVQFEQ
jgi:glycosyltransferase involved in cell wall biosynthesis